jgi:hypothetical protein
VVADAERKENLYMTITGFVLHLRPMAARPAFGLQ